MALTEREKVAMVDVYKLQDEVQIISEPREMQAELIALTLYKLRRNYGSWS